MECTKEGETIGKREIDIEVGKGNLNNIIWILCYPNIFTLLIQHGFSFFEGAIVSLRSTAELSVLSIGFPFVFIITNMAFGLGIGINSVTSRLIGEKKWGNGSSVVVTVMVFSLTFGALIGVLLLLLLPIILSFAGTPSSLAKNTLDYLLPYMVGSPVIFIHSAVLSILKGMGNMKDNAKAAAVTILFNALADFILLNGFWIIPGIGVLGIGWGSITARVIGLLTAYRFFHRVNFIRIKDLKLAADFSFPLMKEAMLISIPTGLSKSAQPVAMIFLNSLLLSFGSAAVGARGLGSRLDALYYLPAMALIPVTITLVGKLSGEGNMEMVKKTIIRINVFVFVTTCAITAVTAVWPSIVWKYITRDAELMKIGFGYLRIFGVTYPLAAIDIINNSALQGLGLGYPTLVTALMRIWGISLPFSYIFVLLCRMGLEGIWLAFALGNVAAVLVSTLWLLRTLKRFENKIHIKGVQKEEELV